MFPKRTSTADDHLVFVMMFPCSCLEFLTMLSHEVVLTASQVNKDYLIQSKFINRSLSNLRYHEAIKAVIEGASITAPLDL